jgi:BirA family biotin operon repressor/biotin-[acetyl-CoA-carboxylase] ligase
MPEITRIETLLRARTRFVALRHEASCPSTQDLAATTPRDASGRFLEAVFWADHQTRGRGRQQRHWHDEPGQDLAVTFRIRQALPEPAMLPAAVPVAVALACEPLLGRPLRIKWPNDLYLDGQKLSGVLIDAGVLGPDTYLIGIGVNCNRVRFPPELEHTATSLALASGHPVDRGELLLALAGALDRTLVALANGNTADLVQTFRDRLGLLGRRVHVLGPQPFQGVLTDLDFTRLVLDDKHSLPLVSVRSLQAS